jgi:hypothetical protein
MACSILCSDKANHDPYGLLPGVRVRLDQQGSRFGLRVKFQSTFIFYYDVMTLVLDIRLKF